MFKVRRGPVAEQRDQLRVQRHVAVVTQLAQWDAQPVVAADLHHRVGLEGDQLTDPHAGASQQLHHKPIPRIAAGAGGGHEFGRVPIVKELR
jgi:hypothetical protein